MSFKYRKSKRKIANEILSELIKVEVDPEDPPSVIYEEYPTAEMLMEKLSKYTLQQIISATDLLAINKHVSKQLPSEESPDYAYGMSAPYIVITTRGEEALYEGWYDKENEKDRLETFKLMYDLYFPAVSLILSILAVILSIIALVHGWGKK